MHNQFVLRRADTFDADVLSQLSQKTFRETFVEDFSIRYPEEDLHSFFRSSASPEWFTDKIVDPKRVVWLVEDKINSQPVAYAVAGPCNNSIIPHPDVCPEKDGLLNRLFVRRDRQSHGFGQQLMNTIISWLEEYYPARPIWLSVFSENLKAQNFYAHYGFKKVGEYNYCIGEWKDHGFIMKRQVDI